MLNKSSNQQHTLCQLCKMSAINPIMLICSHSLCLKCGQNIQIQETSSQIQNKYRIQCPRCRKVTHTYDIKNLILENNELNLITDSSEMDREILNESSLCHQRNEQEAILGRRKSNIYQIPESNKCEQNQSQSSNTLYTDTQFNKKKPTVGSEKISPARQMGQGHQKKPSYPIQLGLDLFNETKSKTQQKVTDISKPNNNTPNATPYSTPLGSQLLSNFDYTDYKKYNPSSQQPQSNLSQPQPQPQYQQQYQQIANQMKFEKLLFNDDKKNSTPKYAEQQKENQFQKEAKKEVSEPSRHKRSATGLVNNQDPEQQEQASNQIIQQYFKMVEKNMQKLEKNLLTLVHARNVDPQTLYSKLKQLSIKIGDQEGDLVQSVRVMVKLQAELTGLSTPSYHRKTSSHQNTSHRYTNNSTNNKTHEKSDHSTTSIPHQEMKIYKKFL